MSTKIHVEDCPVCGSRQLEPYLSCKDYLTTREVFALEKCCSCGFMLTQDFPTEEEIGRYYEASAYVSHSDTHKGIVNTLYHWARQVALKSKAGIIKRYAARKTGTLLDVGSGTGYFLNKMKKFSWSVQGVEKSDTARMCAVKNFGVDCHDSSYLYEIAPQTKDVITLWHVLEHLECLNAAMQQIHAVLKDDGIAVIALPNKNSLDAAYYNMDWAAYDVPRHLWHFSPADFMRFADKHGFNIMKIKPMYLDIFYISMLSEKSKGTFLAGITGFVKGFFFFLRVLKNKERCSSLIYILTKRA